MHAHELDSGNNVLTSCLLFLYMNTGFYTLYSNQMKRKLFDLYMIARKLNTVEVWNK